MGQHEGNPSLPTWKTPDFVLNRVRKAFGGKIGLDPATSSDNPTDATVAYCDNGLTDAWPSTLTFLNPPWGRRATDPIRHWLTRAAEQGQTIAIAPASTNALWFHREVWKKAQAVCFPRGRIEFEPPDGVSASSAKHDTCIICYSSNFPELRDRFLLAFETMGRVVIL